ncbi:MAG TPA: hypothetical protein DEA27_04580 [Candidatus Moranbacteria bacterium]|nr:hypothetical protein [Candidatus Moranbacteria bacterium]
MPFPLRPPPNGATNEFKNVPLVHKICEFYKSFYQLSSKLSKRDRFGMYLKIENICLEIMDLIIEAALESKQNKLRLVIIAHIKIEKLKRFFRMAHELNIIDYKKYISFQADLREISKNTNNWISYLKNSKVIASENPTQD